MGSHLMCLSCFVLVPGSFLVILALHILFIFCVCVSLQVTEVQRDHVKVASATIQNVLANPDKETTDLIKVAQEDYESEYFFFILEYVVFVGIIWMYPRMFFQV